MTLTETKALPLGVGDDVRFYDDGRDGRPVKMATGEVTEVGEYSFEVKWDDMEDPIEYNWHEVELQGNQIFELNKQRKMTDTKTKSTRTPRSYDAIQSGALSLTLKERVDLKNALQASIEKEVAELKAKSEEANKLAGL